MGRSRTWGVRSFASLGIAIGYLSDTRNESIQYLAEMGIESIQNWTL
jgi:hypothetical protein